MAVEVEEIGHQMSHPNGERSNKRARYDLDESGNEGEVISAGEGFFEALGTSHQSSRLWTWLTNFSSRGGYHPLFCQSVCLL